MLPAQIPKTDGEKGAVAALPAVAAAMPKTVTLIRPLGGNLRASYQQQSPALKALRVVALGAWIIFAGFYVRDMYKLLGDTHLSGQDKLMLFFPFFIGAAFVALLALIQQYGLRSTTIATDGISDRFLFSIGKWKLPIWTRLGRNKRRWADLECVRFQDAAGLSAAAAQIHSRGDCLVFDWKVTKMAAIYNTTYINLSELDPLEHERLFACLSLNVPQERLSPEVLYLQVKALSGHASRDLSDFTHVWLEQYSRNFELSNYVTMAPGTVCGNGRFVITMLIAARFNSSTYLASGASGQKVVIKELVTPVDSDILLQQKMLQQFNREAGLLANLSHPGIVEVRDHFIENGRSYIVMPHVEGKNIREYISKNGPMPEVEALKVASQLISVLQYLHHHDPVILHRDFTPDNLIYDHSGRVVVVDFGAANVYDTGKTATLIGKQNYMPPEQLQGKACPASDIYAFGATVCYLVTGQDLVSMGKLPALKESTISSELLSLLGRCTDFDFDKRPDCDTICQFVEKLKDEQS